MARLTDEELREAAYSYYKISYGADNYRNLARELLATRNERNALAAEVERLWAALETFGLALEGRHERES